MRHTLATLLIATSLTLGGGAAMAAPKPHYPPPPPPPPPPAFSWTGAYVGANLGYSWGNAHSTYNGGAGFTGFGIPNVLLGGQHVDGFIGGVQLGYNWQASNMWVYGLETDFQGSGERGNGNFGANYFFDFPAGFSALNASVTTKILWFGTVRARAGYLIRPDLLIYATGGLAYGSIKSAGNFTDTNLPASWAFGGTSTQVGWTVGGGVEGAVWNSSAWTWKVEYLYIDYGTLNFSGVTGDASFPTYAWSTHVTDNIVRGGVNYKFW
ncbi:MAG: porin family protein [Xanthobacteraceae bacterium]